MIPDMDAALDAARAAAAQCDSAAELGDVKGLEESAAAAELGADMAKRIANVVAPHWVGAAKGSVGEMIRQVCRWNRW